MNVFLSDILDQPAALDMVLDFYTGEGEDLLREAANSLKEYPRIVLTSMGSAYYSLLPTYYAFSRNHPNVHIFETAEIQEYSLFPGTAYLLMSRSGESGEIAEYSMQLRKHNEHVLAITMTPSSTMAQNANILLPDPAPYDGFICTKAYTSMALVGLLLAFQFAERLDSTLIANLRRMTAWLESNKKQVLEQVADIPWLGSDITFLSRYEGMGIAMSGALWVAEGARLRADFSSIDQFRHGPIEQVDHSFHGVWIDLKNDTFAEQNVQKIIEMGGNFASVRVVDQEKSGIVIPTFDLPIPFRLLATAMPVQMIAYQSGMKKGHVPGEMRYLNWVVK